MADQRSLFEELIFGKNLPEITELIFENLDNPTIAKCRLVSKSWNKRLERIWKLRQIQKYKSKELFIIDFERCREIDGLVNDPVFDVCIWIDHYNDWKNALETFERKASEDQLESMAKLLKDYYDEKNYSESLEVRFRYSSSHRSKNKYGAYSPIHLAAKKNDSSLVEIVDVFDSLSLSVDMNSKDCDGQTPLLVACKNGSEDIVKLLIENAVENGIDVNAIDDKGRSVLHNACRSQSPKCVELLLNRAEELNIDVNAPDEGGTKPILHACKQGKTEIVRLMFEQSEICNIDLTATDRLGKTVTHLACWRSETNTLKFILENATKYGVDLNARDHNGQSPLHSATYSWTILREMVQFSLKNNRVIKFDSLNDYGNTILHTVCAEDYHTDNSKCVRYILQLFKNEGININARNSNGDTPYMFTEMARNPYHRQAFIDMGNRWRRGCNEFPSSDSDSE